MVAAITFPRLLPNVQLFCDGFDTQTDIQPSATRGGEGLLVETGCPLWLAKYHTAPLFGDDAADMFGWLDSIKSPPQPVLAYDVRKPYPRAYPKGFSGLTRAGGGAFDGTCTLSAVDADGLRLTLSGLPAGFQLGASDALAFNWDVDGAKSRRAYHRITSALASADGSGVLQVEVRPVTRGAYSTGVTVYLEKPAFRGFLVPNSDESPTYSESIGAFKFSILQDLRQL